MFFGVQHLHFAGIGGIGMSGIAEVLLNLGYTISGSDLKLTPVTDRLVRLGATVYEGHDAAHVAGAKALVVSSAVDEQNPEVQEARRLGIPVIPRGELLAELMRLKYGIAVAGSHGKTTTTSMVATVLNHAGLDPTVVVGGRVATMGGSNARVGRSDFLVVESDESDRSFLKLAPILAIVTNIDREHLDCYSSLDDIRAAFVEFVNKVPFYGAVILCLADENVQSILPLVKRRVVTYGRSAQADIEAIEVRCGAFASDFRVRYHAEDLGEFHLGVPGEHNVLNALAAVGVALELKVSPEKIRAGLATFSGVDRRFQVRGKENDVTVIDDYGHHPTEIRATLDAARLCGYRRIHVLFQPHRYTRTFHLMDEFARSFMQADRLYVLDIYAASEKPIEGITAEALAERIRQFGHRSVEYVGSIDKGVAEIAAAVEPGDAVLTLGAGSVWQAGDLILARLRDMKTGAGTRGRGDAGKNRTRGRGDTGTRGKGRARAAGAGRTDMGRAEQKGEFRWRLWANVVIGCVVLGILIFTCRAVRRFAVTDTRFALASPDERSAGLSMDGLVYTSRERVLANFTPDFGRSVFLLPVDERRRRLLAIDWVEDAYIARILPNRVNVRIKERTPVAFVNLPVPGGRGSRVMLVDGEGVLLDPPAQSQFRFPVLTGVTGEQTEVERQYRVHAMLRLLDDLGPMAKDISEVNATTPENLMIVTQLAGRGVQLVMGNRNFSLRLRNFLEHYPEIRRRSGNVRAFDLRLDDRITAGNQEP